MTTQHKTQQEVIGEALQAVSDELLDEMDCQWEDSASKACIGRSYEDGSVYFDEPDEDAFRKEFASDLTADELLATLKTNNAFMDALNELIKTYAEQKDLPEDAGIDYEPDWETMYNN